MATCRLGCSKASNSSAITGNCVGSTPTCVRMRSSSGLANPADAWATIASMNALKVAPNVSGEKSMSGMELSYYLLARAHIVHRLSVIHDDAHAPVPRDAAIWDNWFASQPARG